MDKILTPEDEISRPGYYYPPFKEGDWYQGATYAGHSDFAVDWNKRTKAGGWLDDRGEPVLAAADGTVAETTPVDGYVAIDHYGGLERTEYRHMQPVMVKPGDKVKRGDQIGKIGEAGNAPNGTHLHHVQYKRDKLSQPFHAVQTRFLGKTVDVSVGDSDTRPKAWKPPTPVMIQGPEMRATWERSYRQAIAAAKLADADATKYAKRYDEIAGKLVAAEARIAALEAGIDRAAVAEALGQARSIVTLLEPLTDDTGGS